jgi:ADP-heptose:LPS heptosyltransferase
MKRLLIIRFSSLGDVAVAVPVLEALSKQYANHVEITLVSRAEYGDLVESLPFNIRFHAAFFKGKHKGFFGLLKLCQELNDRKYDLIIDLHDNLRSRIISFLFSLKGLSYYTVDKGRKEKRALTSRKKERKTLKPTYRRYMDVFQSAGYSLTAFNAVRPENSIKLFAIERTNLFGEKKRIWLGIAPFAKHEWKIYPPEKMEKVVAHFAQSDKYTLFLFGRGTQELQLIQTWCDRYPRLELHTEYSLSTELKLMSCLDLMVSMDSANMHLAALAGIPVVSIWGATHPDAGFYGLYQKESNIVQIDDLDCRPCSIYGNKPCYRKDFACMNLIEPEKVINKIEDALAAIL